MTRRCIETWRYCPVRCSLLDGRSVAMPFEVLADLFLTVNCKTIFTEYCTVLLAFGFTGLLLLVTDDSSPTQRLHLFTNPTAKITNQQLREQNDHDDAPPLGNPIHCFCFVYTDSESISSLHTSSLAPKGPRFGTNQGLLFLGRLVQSFGFCADTRGSLRIHRRSALLLEQD